MALVPDLLPGAIITYLVGVSTAALPALDVLQAAVRRALLRAAVCSDVDALVVA